jgi:hypothetical protein
MTATRTHEPAGPSRGPAAPPPLSTPAISTRPDERSGSAALADLSIGLAIAGLLPLLPLLGSLAAVVCAALALHSGDPGSRSRGLLGLALGITGLMAPLAFFAVYCGLLGYPFPIHRYQPG